MKRYAGLLLLIIAILSCNKDKTTQTLLPLNATSSQTACFEERPVVRSVNGLQGRIAYSNDQHLYTISYSVPGTYDSVWVGFVCNLPDEFKVLTKQVVFSGEYRKGPDGLVTFGGEETYYLFLTAITAR